MNGAGKRRSIRIYGKRLKRGTAFALACLMAISGIDFGESGVAAAAMTAEEVWDTVTVSHELVSEGREAEITIEEANPGIWIQNVKLIRGNGFLVTAGVDSVEENGPGMATAAEADEVIPVETDVSASLVPNLATPSGPDAATPSEPDAATPSEPNAATPSEPSVDNEEDIPPLDINQGHGTWRFLAEENGNYQFRVIYATAEDDRLVKKSITVDYEVSDIVKAKPMSVAMLTLTSDIHGEGKEEGLEIPLDRNVEGSLIVQYTFPDNVKGGYIDITFPKYVKIVRYPTSSPIDGSKTKVTSRSVDGVKVYTLHVAILDNIMDDIQFQVDYKSDINTPHISPGGRLRPEEINDYIYGQLAFGSIRAEAFDGNDNPITEAEIGPLTAKWNEGEPWFRLKRSGSDQSTIDINVDNYKLESQMISPYLGISGGYGWFIEHNINDIYKGAPPALLKQLKVYAPRHFQFDVSGIPGADGFIRLGEDAVGHYMIYDIQKRGQNRFRGDYREMRYVLAAGESIEGGGTFLPPAMPQLSYVSGEDKVQEQTPLASITVGDRQYTEADQLKVSHDMPQPVYAGTAISFQNIITVSNLGEVKDGINVLPEDNLEGAVLTIRFEEGLLPGGDFEIKYDMIDDGIEGPTGSERAVSIENAKALLSDGSTVSMNVYPDVTYRRIRCKTPAGEIPEGSRIVGYRVQFDRMYRDTINIGELGCTIATVNADGTPFPGEGQEPKTLQIEYVLDCQNREKAGIVPIAVQSLPMEDRLQFRNNTPILTMEGSLHNENPARLIVMNQDRQQAGKTILPESSLEGEVLTIILPEEITITAEETEQRLLTLVRILQYDTVLPGYPARGDIASLKAVLNDGTVMDMDITKGCLNGELAPGQTIRGYQIQFEALFRCQYTIHLRGVKLSHTKADGTPFPTGGGFETLSILGEMTYKGVKKTGSQDLHVKGISVEDLLNYDYPNNRAAAFLPEMSWDDSVIEIPVIQNVGQISPNLVNSTVPNHQGENMVWSMEYPYGISPSYWKFTAHDIRDFDAYPDYRAEGDIDQVLLHLDDGAIIDAPLKKTATRADGVKNVEVDAKDIIPEGRCVIKITAHISKLYQAGYRIYMKGTVPAVRPDGTPFVAESGSMVTELRHDASVYRQEKDYTITPLEAPVCGEFGVSATSPPESPLLQEDAESGYITVLWGDFNDDTKVEGVHPTLEFKGEELLNALDGKFHCFSTGANHTDFVGWKVIYETSMGRSGSYAVPYNVTSSNRTWANLSAGESFTKVIMTYEGVWSKPTRNSVRFSLTTTTEERHNYTQDPDDPAFSYLYGSYIDSGEFTGQQDRTGELSVRLPAHMRALVRRSNMVNTIDQTGFQGAVVDSTLSPRYQVGVPSTKAPNRFPRITWGNETYYIQWLGGNNFTVANEESSPYRYSFVKTADDTVYLKAVPKEPGLNAYSASPSGGSIGTNSVFAAPTIPLSFKIMPGTSTGDQPILGKVYVDLKGYQDSRLEVERLSGVEIDIEGAIADEGGICGDGDTQSKRLFLLSEEVLSTKVALNNESGINAMLGVNQTYEGERLKFAPDERRNLNAVYSISSEQDLLEGYEVVIPIPKTGTEVTYRQEDGTTATAVSQFTMELRGAIALGGISQGASIGYRLGGEVFLSEDEVNGRWDQVSAIRVYIDRFESGTGVKPVINLFLDLEAEEKSEDTLLEAYMAPARRYQTSAGSASPWQYGSLAVFVHGNYEIAGTVWNDRDENGIRDNGERLLEGISLELWDDQERIATVVTGSQGEYQLETWRSDAVSARVLLPEDTVLTKWNASGTTGSNDSDFVRAVDEDGKNIGKYEFGVSVSAVHTNVNAGIVNLPKLTAGDRKVAVNATVMSDAAVTVQSGEPRPAIVYENAEDTEAAEVSATGVITGKKLNSNTTASVWVMNTLGDRVEVTYGIRVLDNDNVLVIPHDWTVIQGDTVEDWWDGVSCGPKEPTRSAGLLSQAFTDYTRTVTFHTDETAGENSEITAEDALSQPGLYYIRYRAEHTDGYGTAVAGLTVQGRVQGDGETVYHFAPKAGMITAGAEQFFYMSAEGERVPVSGDEVTVQPAQIPTDQGVHPVTWTVVHPMADEVTAGVSAGTERVLNMEGTVTTDSKPVLSGLAVREADPKQVLTGLLAGVAAEYTHYPHSGGVESQPDIITLTGSEHITLTGPDGEVLTDGIYEAPAEPGVYTLTYKAVADETYNNGENSVSGTVTVTVNGIIEIEAIETVYTIPGNSGNEEHIKQRIEAKGRYYDAVSDTWISLLPEQFSYGFETENGRITSVTTIGKYVTAGGVEVVSEEAVSQVIVRAIPRVEADPVRIRVDESFDETVGVTLVPADGNTWTADTTEIEAAAIGKWTVPYTAFDPLTGGESVTNRDVYIHGLPEISAQDAITLYTHESTGEAALIDAVKAGGVCASVQYVEEADGQIFPADLTDSITYDVEDSFEALKDGAYQVTLSVSDGAILDSTPILGLTERFAQEKEVTVTVSTKKYQVLFSINYPHMGSYEGEGYHYDNMVAHGGRIEMPNPIEEPGYAFAGYRVKESFKAGSDVAVTLDDGNKTEAVIGGGEPIPAGAVISQEAVAEMIIVEAAQLEAYFSAKPVLKADSIKLYEGETYSKDLLNIRVTDEDAEDVNLEARVEVEHDHVNTDIPGTYGIRLEVEDTHGNKDSAWVYVQVYGRTVLTFPAIRDVSTRQGETLTRKDVLRGVRAIYDKPKELPNSQEPWTEKFWPSTVGEAVITLDQIPDTESIRKATVTLEAPGQLPGREGEGSTMAVRDVYIHGRPVVTAYDNSIYTHQSVQAEDLADSIRTGQGIKSEQGIELATPANAYVEYVRTDGSLEQFSIGADQIQYRVKDYKALTPGSYIVVAEADDSQTVSSAQQPGVVPVVGTTENTVKVEDKIYTVVLLAGEHGSFPSGTSLQISTVHGRSVDLPELLIEYGYQVDQWKDDTGRVIGDVTKYPITSDITISVSFKLKEYEVRFIGRHDRLIAWETVKHGYSATPPIHDRDVRDKRFDGWSESYQNVTSDRDLYTTYRTQTGPGIGGGDGMEPGMDPGPGVVLPPGIDADPGITPPQEDGGGTHNPGGSGSSPNPDVAEIDGGKVPGGFVSIPQSELPELPFPQALEEVDQIGYRAVLVGGTTHIESDLETPEIRDGDASTPVSHSEPDAKRCVLHRMLLIVAMLEGIYLIYKRRKDKRKKEEFRQALKEEAANVS